MNRNLVLLSILLILGGVGTGFFILSLLGALFLIPALLAPARPTLPRAPAPQKQETRRIIQPIPIPEQLPVQAAPPQTPGFTAPLVTQPHGFSAPLFPTTMFPSLSQMGSQVQPPAQAQASKPETRDELVEVGAIIALLKLAFG